MTDLNSLQYYFPFIKEYNKNDNRIRNILKLSYEEYVIKVSNAEMAISLETSTFLYFFCENIKPNKILDLGSGFSSYVFRLFSSHNHKTTITSVDDNLFWLNKTKEFLEKYQLNIDNMFSWNEFIVKKYTDFDFIFYDLGSMENRIKYLSKVMDIGSKSIIFLDDTDKIRYLIEVKNECKKRSRKFFNLESYTRDHFGRFGGIII